MTIKKTPITNIFKYIWWLLALATILYIVSQNIVTQRVLTYNLDFKQSISRDITGWYPEVRTKFSNNLEVLAEPIYLQAYVPAKFNNLNIKGDLDFVDENIRLGLKQDNNIWLWQDITDKSFSLDFDLKTAQVYRNKLELILSIPDLNSGSNVALTNNWQLILSK